MPVGSRGDEGGMHCIGIGIRHSALAQDVSDGVVVVAAEGVGLIRPEGASSGNQPVEIVVRKEAGGGEEAVGDAFDVAHVVITISQVLERGEVRMRSRGQAALRVEVDLGVGALVIVVEGGCNLIGVIDPRFLSPGVVGD